MGRQPTKKKIPQVAQKPQEPVTQAFNPIQLKIKPTHCLMAHKMDGKQNYKQFRAKLKYPKVFRFDESAFGDRNYDARSLWFLKLYRKTKYLQGFELIGAQTTRKGPMAKLVQRVPKVRSVKLQTFGLRSFESCPPGDRFSFIFKAFGRLNPSSLHVRMASEFGIDNNNLSQFIQSVFRYIQTLSSLRAFSLILKRYLKIFGITSFSGNSDFAVKQNRLFRSVREQFKRLKKIEDLRLLFIAPPQSILEGFISSFTHLQKLRNIEVLSVDAHQGKNIIESLSGLKFLESITLCNHFEPNDILYLVQKTPSLRNIIFKDEWKFTNKKIPILSEIKPKDVNIVKLHLNNPVNADTQENVVFLVDFLSIFTKLQSLQLYIVCRNDVEPITDPIAKQINKFTHLESLTLGLCMATGFLASQFLSHIKDLKQLKKLTLMTKVTFEEVLTKSWGEQIQALLQVLTAFVLQSKNLMELRTFWGNFTQQISDGLITLVKKLDKLDVFELAYKHAFQNHGAGHDHVIEGLIKMLKQMNQTNDVSIMTYCPMASGKSCDKKAKKMYEIAENNPNIKKVCINLTTGIITPFEADL